MKVLSDGAVAAGSSLVVAYSNSKATMISPMPTANPLTGRLAGVVLTPRKAVASARAGDAAIARKMTAVTTGASGRRSLIDP